MALPLEKCGFGYSFEIFMVCSSILKEFKICKRLGDFSLEPPVRGVLFL